MADEVTINIIYTWPVDTKQISRGLTLGLPTNQLFETAIIKVVTHTPTVAHGFPSVATAAFE